MRLHYLKIEGFRKHLNTEIYFSDNTFLIGENNIGKSSILQALDYLLRDEKKIKEEEFYHYENELGESIRLSNEIILTAEFRNLPEESLSWRGFKGRVLRYESEDETGLKIIYRKKFKVNSNSYEVEMMQYPKSKKSNFEGCKTFNDFIDGGLDRAYLEEKFGKFDPHKRLSAPQLKEIDELEELYDFNEDREDWFKNPGGIPANVLSKLPKFLLIPAQDKTDELNGASGTLIKTMNELFSDVREQSDNYKKAQEYLLKLAKELNPNDEESELGIMIKELNHVMGQVFPNSGIIANATLSDADKVIKPQFNISMYSNVTTSVELQGTGMIRAAVFGLLRYKNERDLKKEANGEYIRPVIVGFEEPEIYMHPNAAMQMRETIYELALSKNNQIVCTTHSPYMIDLSKKPKQVLNSLSEIEIKIAEKQVETINANAFNITDAFMNLLDEEKEYVKMLLKIDDYVSKAFFVKNVLIVEGDTEEIVIKETISRLPDKERKDVLCNWQLIKARGKAAIIPLVRYLKLMGINPYVIHDKDSNKPGAIKFNEPIRATVGNDKKIWVLENCVEDILGYEAPNYDKPYKAYKFINDNWGNDWLSISEKWRNLIEEVLDLKDFYYNNYVDVKELVASTK